jgi:hypothetical protein
MTDISLLRSTNAKITLVFPLTLSVTGTIGNKVRLPTVSADVDPENQAVVPCGRGGIFLGCPAIRVVSAVAIGLTAAFGAGAIAATMIRTQATETNVVFFDDRCSFSNALC